MCNLRFKSSQQLHIVKHVFASRPVFLARRIHQTNIITGLKTFDDAVYDNIAKMMINIANLDATRKRLRHLPGDLGGLGIDH
jgi:hypothetical protein